MRIPVGRLLIAIGIAAILVSGAWGGASATVYDKLTRVPGGCPARFGDDSPVTFSTPADARFDTSPYWMPAPEEVTFPSRDPWITISGWWLPAASPDAPVVVMVHGLRACKRDYTVLLPAGMLARNGFSVLLFDLRDHGDTTRDDGRQTGGAEESQELLGAWDWLRETRGVAPDRIGVAGLSFGAAIGLIAAAREHRIAAIWADSAYTDVGTLMRDQVRADAIPAYLDVGARFVGRLLSGHDLDTYSPLTAVGELAQQALFLTHGGADNVIPPRHTELLAQAATDAGLDSTLWIVPGAFHTAAEYSDAAEYERRLVAFFAASLTDQP